MNLKIIYITFLLHAIFWNSSLAQTFCETDSNIPDPLSLISPSQFVTASDNYVVRIYIHVMRQSNGTGGQTQAEVNTALNTIVSDYQDHNICFSLLGMDEIHNDTYYNQTNFDADQDGDGKFDNFSPNSHANAIDIYLFANDRLNFGLASSIPSTALVIGGTAFGSNLASSHVLSHEIGHCLGLYHTFHGLCESGCAELVNGDNSETCVDFVSDTPADPTFFNMNESTCAWNGSTCGISTTDANGQTYNPDLTLIMAYTTPACMAYHTAGQGSRVRDMLANSSLLQNVIVPNDMTLNTLTINTGQNILYDVLNTLTIQNSSVESGGILTLRAGDNVFIEPGFHSKNNSNFLALINDQCSTIDRNNSARPRAHNVAVLEFDKPSREYGEDDIMLFPNPQTSKAEIRYMLSDLNVVTISILNANGVKILAIKDNELQTAGAYEISFDLSDKSSGVYLCVFEKKNMETGKYVRIFRKIVKR